MRILPLLIALIALVGCRDYRRHYHLPTPVSGGARARALLSKADRRAYDSLYFAAVEYQLKENYDSALYLLDKALAVHPNGSEALFQRARLAYHQEMAERSQAYYSALAEQGTLDTVAVGVKDAVEGVDTAVSSLIVVDSAYLAKADAGLLRAYQLEPRNIYYARVLAQRYANQEKYTRAAHVVSEIARMQPTEGNYDLLFKLQYAAKQYDSALVTLDHLEQMQEDEAEVATKRIDLYEEMGDRTKMFHHASLLAERFPHRLYFRVYLAELYARHGYPEMAQAVMQDVSDTHPTDLETRAALVGYYFEHRQMEAFHQWLSNILRDKAVEAEEKVQLLDHFASKALEDSISRAAIYQHFLAATAQPAPASQLAEMAAYYAQELKFDADSLLPLFEACVRDQPDNLQSRVKLWQTYLMAGRPADAERVLREGKDKVEMTFGLHFLLAQQLHGENRTEEAIAEALAGLPNLATAENPEAQSEYHGFLADMLHSVGRTREAYQHYEQAVKQADNDVALNNFAYFLAVEGKQLRKALELSQRLTTLSPDDPNHLDTHAWVLYRNGRHRQAREVIDRALQLFAQSEEEVSPVIYDHAGDIYLRCGLRRQAREYWKQALKLMPDPQLERQLRRKLHR